MSINIDIYGTNMTLMVMGTRALTSYCVALMVCGCCEYLHVWDVAVGEMLPCSNNEDGNLRHLYMVAVKRGAIIVGQKFHVNVFLNT